MKTQTPTRSYKKIGLSLLMLSGTMAHAETKYIPIKEETVLSSLRIDNVPDGSKLILNNEKTISNNISELKLENGNYSNCFFNINSAKVRPGTKIPEGYQLTIGSKRTVQFKVMDEYLVREFFGSKTMLNVALLYSVGIRHETIQGISCFGFTRFSMEKTEANLNMLAQFNKSQDLKVSFQHRDKYVLKSRPPFVSSLANPDLQLYVPENRID